MDGWILAIKLLAIGEIILLGLLVWLGYQILAVYVEITDIREEIDTFRPPERQATPPKRPNFISFLRPKKWMTILRLSWRTALNTNT